MASKASFRTETGAEVAVAEDDRLYFPNLPANAEKVEVTYTFIALTLSDSRICPYAVVGEPTGSPPPKYDTNFCNPDTEAPIAGRLTLNMTKTSSFTQVEQGEVVAYSIFYQNTGADPVESVWIWDDIPAATSIVTGSITPPNDSDRSTAGRVAWKLGAVPAGASGTLQFSVLVDGAGQDVADGTELVNQAFLAINPGSILDLPVLTRAATTTVQAPALAISKTDNQTTVNAGDAFDYTIRLTNNGAVTATNVPVTDTLPANVILAGAATPNFSGKDGQILTWDDVGPIPPGDDVQITIPAAVKAGVPDQTVLTNQAAVSYQNSVGHVFADQTATDDTTASSDGSGQTTTVQVTKEAVEINGQPLAVGDIIRYTIEVENTGTQTAASNVTVVDDLPDGVLCQSVSGDNAPPGCAGPRLLARRLL